MLLPPSVRERCEDILGGTIRHTDRLSGGDINQARRLVTDHGDVFLKMNMAPQADAMFTAEAHGLELLASTETLQIPRVLGRGQASDYAFLLLEYIEQGAPAGGFWQDFGHGLARLHQNRQANYGLDRDNFIGSLPQFNQPHSGWLDFYREQRLMPQLRLALGNGRLTPSDSKAFDQLFERLPDLLPTEDPCLIHGDLWNGNFLAENSGRAVLIDPAVSFSHREADLAMTRLFGGFSPAFYHAYHEAFPLQKNWESRLELYQLYYLLVHVNLFGGSYVLSVRNIVKRFI